MVAEQSSTGVRPDAAQDGEVGLFWVVEQEQQPFVLAVSAPSSEAQRYGDHLMLDLGHYEHWQTLAAHGVEALRAAGLPTAPAWSEYEEWPRGRVSYDAARSCFVILADRKLHRPEFIALIAERFRLRPETVQVRRDPHYVSTRQPTRPV